MLMSTLYVIYIDKITCIRICTCTSVLVLIYDSYVYDVTHVHVQGCTCSYLYEHELYILSIAKFFEKIWLTTQKACAKTREYYFAH